MPAGERQRTAQKIPHLQETTLLEALASTDRLGELLTLLHHHAASAAGGGASILFEVEGHSDLLRATSASGTGRLPSGVWRSESLPPSLHAGGAPIFAPDLSQYMPGLAEHLESVAGVLVPLTHVGLPMGLLVAACAKAPSDAQRRDLALVGHAFALALARDRAAIDSALHREARELGSDFSSTISTADTQLEAERIKLRDRLHQSEKLAALGQLVAGIAHELNNPLQAVLGHLELLREGSGLTRPVRRDIQMVYREADRAAKIVGNLLAFAGSRRPVRKLTNINALMSRVLSLRSAALRWAGIEVIRHHSEGLPRIKTDPLLLQQALLNIVLNAEQAIGLSGGRIETRTAINQTSDRHLVAVEIRDTGPGIAPEVLPRIFEPFYTTKEAGEGTGLGLAIAYGLVHEHGGDITVRNHPDGGALFTVQLPVETG